MAYDLWNLGPSKLPPRSRLYSLEPIAVGTGRVESLTSYVMRLAEAHTVSVRVLIRREIFPNLPASPKDTAFEEVHSLNGMGSCFERWVNVLEKLTARNDLRALTPLPWQSFLSCGGILRRRRAWCPSCCQKWRHSDMPIYECLLWALAPLTACPIHEALLEEHCPSCRKSMFLLSAHGRPGFCAHCGRWLGDSVSPPLPFECKQPTEDQRWIAKELGELYALGATVSDSSPCHLRICE
jgi:TniQ